MNGPAQGASYSSLPVWFERQVARIPRQVAVQMGSDVVTYVELNARANQLARFLVEQRIGPECIVALRMPCSIDLIVAVWGTWKTGAAYLPVDPAHPEGRVRAMLEQAAPQLVLSEVPERVGSFPATNLTDADRTARLRPLHPAYVIYTSGSTGVPKAVVMPCLCLLNLMSWYTSWKEIGRVAQFSALGFDVSVMEIAAAALGGGTLVLPHMGVRKDIDELTRWLVEYELNELIAPNLVLELVCENAQATGRAMPALRDLAQGGESLVPSPAIRRFCASVDTRRLYNYYGPTETHLTTAFTLPADTTTWPVDVPIGQPIPNVQSHVLDQRLRPVPAGETGELYLAGVQLARGYLNQPGRTAERFVADPLGGPGERMYRTGDLVRAGVDGRLGFVGRVDHQVKVRGFRVELGEIEACLRAHPQVAQAAVIATGDRPGHNRLTAYVVASPEQVDPAELRRHLAGSLPDYMLPAVFVMLDRMPLNTNGKLDRNALPEPTGRARYRPAETLTEAVLCGLFSEVLGVSPVGVDDDFLALGGHSLTATQVIGRVRSRLRVELPLRALFEHPTPSGLAKLVRAADPARGQLGARFESDRNPLSFPQRRLWFLHRLEGPGATDNLALGIRLTGEVDRDALAAALRDVVERHHSLRTAFPEVDGAPVQRVLPTRDWPGLQQEWVDERALTTSLREAATYPFDLSGEAPFRAWLFTWGPERHVLLLLIHHIAADGWSMRPLGRDLSEAYRARLRGGPPGWRPLPLQYPDYAAWQRELLGGGQGGDRRSTREPEFWQEALAGLPRELPLSFDRQRGSTAARERATVPIALDASLHGRLADLARESGATPFMVLHAGLVVLLSRLGAGTDIPIGTPALGRPDEMLEDLIGCFVNTLVLRVRMTGSPSVADLITQVREVDLAALAHQETPFEQLVELLNPERAVDRHPLFQVLFALNGDAGLELDVPGVSSRTELLPSGGSRFDLAVHLSEQYDTSGLPAGIDGELHYDARLFERATAERIAGSYGRALRAMVDDPSRPVRRIRLLRSEERRHLVSGAGAAGTPSPPFVPELFEQQARRAPGARAVAAADHALTYQELNAGANQLAHYLAARGVGPELRVAVLLPPSTDLVLALLGILKAGAAYLPVDAGYPAKRIRSLLDDARPALVITSGAAAARLAGSTPTLRLDVWKEVVAPGYPQVDPQDADRTTVLLPAHPAYVIYTSGSTGRPKGVVVEHRALGTYVGAARERYPGIAGTALLHASTSFDATVTSLYVPLTSGGCVLIGALADHGGQWHGRPSFLKLTPTLLDLLASSPDYAPSDCLVVGGEPLHGGQLARWRSRHPEVPVYHAYGPTETTVNCTELRLGPDDPTPRGPVPIGTPLDGAQIYLLDAALDLVAPGLVGEIYVGGSLLARGYLHQPAVTAERFVASPFGSAGSRLYRTGDLARRLPDGALQFVGRSDDQVKIRGVRVEPGEVERVLAGHPDVAQAAVIPREVRPGDWRLVAYLAPAPGRCLNPTELRSYAADELPLHLLPASIVELPTLPMSVGGKLDRSALPGPGRADPSDDEPRSRREEQLCELLAESLEVPQVGVQDSFFELGGHSLLVPRLVDRIREVLGLTLSIRDLFEAPSARELARLPAGRADADPFAAVLPLRLGGTSGGRAPLFCVHPATGVSWAFSGLLRHLEGDRSVYGLQAPWLRRPAAAPADPDALLDSYLEQLRSVPMDGPFCLLGWSMGGVIAHALAVRLQQEGHEVGLLVLLDSYPRGVDEVPGPGAPAGPTILPDLRQAAVHRSLGNLRRALSAHPPGVYHGRPLLFVADAEPDHPFTADTWQPYVSEGVETHAIACTHQEMIQPGVLAQIGPVVSARLREVDAR